MLLQEKEGVVIEMPNEGRWMQHRCIRHTAEMTEKSTSPYQSTTIRNVLSVTLLH